MRYFSNIQCYILHLKCRNEEVALEGYNLWTWMMIVNDKMDCLIANGIMNCILLSEYLRIKFVMDFKWFLLDI